MRKRKNINTICELLCKQLITNKKNVLINQKWIIILQQFN